MQVHKSLGDLAAGTALYEHYSSVPADVRRCRSQHYTIEQPSACLLWWRLTRLRTPNVNAHLTLGQMLELRKIVMARKEPRKLLVCPAGQPHVAVGCLLLIWMQPTDRLQW